jgi:hypothetical protein
MATHKDHNDHKNLNPEGSGIKASPVLLFLGVLAVATVITFGIIWGVLYGLEYMEAMSKPEKATELPAGQDRRFPPEPRLQGAPAPGLDGLSNLPEIDMDEYRKQQDSKAKSYKWVNKEAGIARIPIDRAKAMIMEKGLPMASEELTRQVERAEQARRRILSAESSAGRTIGGQ